MTIWKRFTLRLVIISQFQFQLQSYSFHLVVMKHCGGGRGWRDSMNSSRSPGSETQ
jgi:hypothetical protein